MRSFGSVVGRAKQRGGQGTMTGGKTSAGIVAARQLRRDATTAEALLWEALRDRRLDGLKFRRQHPVRPFVLDFFCPACKLAIELDGDIHDDQREQDEARTEYLVSLGYRVIRFNNEEVFTVLPTVVGGIARAATHNDQEPSPPSLSIPMEREGGQGGG